MTFSHWVALCSPLFISFLVFSSLFVVFSVAWHEWENAILLSFQLCSLSSICPFHLHNANWILMWPSFFFLPLWWNGGEMIENNIMNAWNNSTLPFISHCRSTAGSPLPSLTSLSLQCFHPSWKVSLSLISLFVSISHWSYSFSLSSLGTKPSVREGMTRA